MSNGRIFLLILFFIGFGGAVIARLFFLQIQENNFYRVQAKEIEDFQDIPLKRGDIFIQDKEGNLYLLATTKSFLRVYLSPQKISPHDEQLIIDSLSGHLRIPAQAIKARFAKKDDPYEPIQEKVPIEKFQELKELIRLLPEGVGIQEYKDRFYPYQGLASHLLGFVGFSGRDKKGLYGLEQYYDELLSAPKETLTNAKNSFTKFLSLGKAAIEKSEGASLVLSLDINIQSQVEKILSELIKKWSSPSGSIIVMRPTDGAILAMASFPSFDPNSYGEVIGLQTFVNPVLQSVFEPGSIIKPVTLSAGIDSGAINPQTTYEDTGSVKRDGYTIHNAGERTFGKRNMLEVLQFSINTGAVFVAEKVGREKFLRYLERFGFGSKTGIDLPGEVTGDITNLDTGREVNLATASFGQGISATPIQVLMALNVLINEGKLVQPFLVERVLYPEGSQEVTQVKTIRQVITPQSAAKLSAMMVEVVEKGYSKKARVAGYTVGGKTGTAQIPDPKGGYLEQTIHSFLGFAPAFSPQFVILIKLDEPTGIRFASDSIAPYFSQLAHFILNYYQIRPDKEADL